MQIDLPFLLRVLKGKVESKVNEKLDQAQFGSDRATDAVGVPRGRAEVNVGARASGAPCGKAATGTAGVSRREEQRPVPARSVRKAICHACIRADYVTLVAREWRSSAPTSRMSQTTFSQPPEPLTSTPSRIPASPQRRGAGRACGDGAAPARGALRDDRPGAAGAPARPRWATRRSAPATSPRRRATTSRRTAPTRPSTSRSRGSSGCSRSAAACGTSGAWSTPS